MKKLFILITLIVVSSIGCQSQKEQEQEQEKDKDKADSIAAVVGKVKENVINTWNELNNIYQKRIDLIDQLINITEPDLKNSLSDLKASVQKAKEFNFSNEVISNEKDFNDFKSLQENVSGDLPKVSIEINKHPNLKANKNLSDVLSGIESTNEMIVNKRANYNEITKEYNIALQKADEFFKKYYPDYSKIYYFMSENNAAQAPKVKF